MMLSRFRNALGSLACVALLASGSHLAIAEDTFTIVVMDPLSKPLSCDCVKGYAQRDYAALGKVIEEATGQTVKLVWHQSLAEALKDTDGKADLVVGKHSVVVADAKNTAHKLTPVASLTGKDGGTKQHGLIVVRSADPAEKLDALGGYEILFGPLEAAEKSTSAEQALKAAGIKIGPIGKRYGACSEAATAMLAMPKDKAVAAVISSYAEPLLQGCGSIREGELRVVGRTRDIPFVTAFLSDNLSGKLSEDVQIAMLTAGANPRFLKSMETLAGFVPWVKPEESTPLKETRSKTSSDWPQFRGLNRDGRVERLPDRLPQSDDQLVWSQPMPSDGVGGIAVAQRIVIVGGRDADDAADTWTALSLDDGRPLWQHAYPAPAALDYGNTPRATPAIHHGVVFSLGATGNLSAVDLNTGSVLWRVNLSERFGAEVPTWGFCSSPLVIDGNLYVQLGARTPLVALDTTSGKTVWAGPGRPAGYSSLVSTPVRGQTMLIGTDRLGYFIRAAKNGQYRWLAKRKIPGDFAVPAAVTDGQTIYFTGENNGIEGFDLSRLSQSQPIPGPHTANDDLLPDSHTPVLAGAQMLVAYEGLHSLNPKRSLTESWALAADRINGYASIIASQHRALVTTEEGELLLFDLDQPALLDSMTLQDDGPAILSHPAISDERLVVRVGNELRCYALDVRKAAPQQP